VIDQQLENVEYNLKTNDANYIREIKPTIAMAKAAFKKRRLFFQKIGL